MMENRFGAMLISLHEHFKIRITDWLLSAILFSWGFTLLWTDPRVWAFPTFSGLAQYASQTTWALIALSIGVARMAALFVNGAVRRSPHLRAVGAALSALIWAELTLGLMWSEIAGPGIGIFPWLALADVLNVYRAAVDARSSDDRAKKYRRSAARAVPNRA